MRPIGVYGIFIAIRKSDNCRIAIDAVFVFSIKTKLSNAKVIAPVSDIGIMEVYYIKKRDARHPPSPPKKHVKKQNMGVGRFRPHTHTQSSTTIFWPARENRPEKYFGKIPPTPHRVVLLNFVFRL